MPDELRSHAKRVLIYTGFSQRPWSGRSLLARAEGGSEHAMASLAEALCRLGYQVVISGTVDACEHAGVLYLPASKLQAWLDSEPVDAILVSRYLHFLDRYRYRCRKLLLVAHDVSLLPWGCFEGLPRHVQLGRVLDLLEQHDDRIDAVVCQSRWHAQLFTGRYPAVAERISVIGSGVDPARFGAVAPAKVAGRFVYCSCADRGLDTVLNLFPQIRQQLPDATLEVFSYERDRSWPRRCEAVAGVSHQGSMPQRVLLPYLRTADVWFYPTRFEETFCITALEMQYARVLCVCSRLAALDDTVGDRGALIDPPGGEGFEERALATLLAALAAPDRKQLLLERAHRWAATRSWDAIALAYRELLER